MKKMSDFAYESIENWKKDKEGQDRIRNIVKKSLIITKDTQLSKDGMFAKKSRVVGTGITRIL